MSDIGSPESVLDIEDGMTDALVRRLVGLREVPAEFNAPDAERRLAGIAQGQHMGTRPGRRRRANFEASPTRVAYELSPEGPVVRGRAGQAHYQLGQEVANRSGMTPNEAMDWIVDMEDMQAEGKIQHGPGFVTREGKFLNRPEQAMTMGYPEDVSGQAGESFAQRKMLSKMSPDEAKAYYRSSTVDPRTQYRRRTRGANAQRAMGKMREERSFLERMSRFGGGSEAVTNRIQQLTARMGRLGNLARRAGVMGLSAALPHLVTPFDTYDAIKGLASDDENVKMKSVETLLGSPEFSTGREPTEEEMVPGMTWTGKTGEQKGYF